MKTKNAYSKIMELAKERLMKEMHISEHKAHQFIVQTAMNKRMRKFDVAYQILNMESLTDAK